MFLLSVRLVFFGPLHILLNWQTLCINGERGIFVQQVMFLFSECQGLQSSGCLPGSELHWMHCLSSEKNA